jgi:serine phosphatase RsbU (regulator of sigma subunit)
MQRDLELAQQVQIALLPQKQPAISGWTFFDHYKAANVIGGDYYDYIPLSDGRVAVIVADVSGHGIAAALMMTKLSAEAKFCLATHDQPAEVIARLNSLLCEDAVDDRFVTMVLLLISPDGGTVHMANAGHLCPVLRSADGEAKDVAESATGLPLGVMDGFEYESASFDVSMGEIVTLVTDGITEATDEHDEEMFGLDRMRKSCQRTSDDLQEYGSLIVQDVQQFSHFAAQGDDICVVCMKRD